MGQVLNKIIESRHKLTKSNSTRLTWQKSRRNSWCCFGSWVHFRLRWRKHCCLRNTYGRIEVASPRGKNAVNNNLSSLRIEIELGRPINKKNRTCFRQPTIQVKGWYILGGWSLNFEVWSHNHISSYLSAHLYFCVFRTWAPLRVRKV